MDLRTVVTQAALGNLDFGVYLPAVERWEGLTRPAPDATEPNSNGNPRLAAPFSEWMMGWDQGWVTDFINPSRRRIEGTISRAAAMKAIGNGVVPQQAAQALRDLLAS